MNDQELESLLRKVAPATPSADLMARLQQARPRPAGKIIAWPGWLLRAALPLAAAAALVLWLGAPEHPPAPAVVAQATPAGYEAVGAEDIILGAEPVGIGHDEAGRPYRMVRSYGLRRSIWKNSADGSEMATMEPQQHLLLARMDVY